MKKSLLVSTLLMLSAVVIPCKSMASTTGHQRVKCSYQNATHPSKNISGTCDVAYGIVGVSGSAFRQVRWSDGVITQINLGKASVTIDGKAATLAKSSIACQVEVYRINGNAIELKGNFCR